MGGGYGGSLVAKELDATADVVLVDPREAFVNAAGSLRALTRPDWAVNVFFPFDTLLERGRVVRDRVVSADPAGVTPASGARLDADYLVLATGSGYAYPAKPHPASESIAAALAPLTARATLAVTERLNVAGYDHVYALGDLTDLPDPKMASYAQVHAQVVAANIAAQLAGRTPETVSTPSPDRRILLPLGPHGGAGQLPAPSGVTAVPAATVSERKGLDLFTARFAARFDRSWRFPRPGFVPRQRGPLSFLPLGRGRCQGNRSLVALMRGRHP
ncbi:hypothetical protein [Actinoplanes sp. NPDC026619]|uniref:hypothetical protein n=1 Tax=Actinoplanes sp. NPDC026619 TaxID=3155798 RepID=UPI0033C81B26